MSSHCELRRASPTAGGAVNASRAAAAARRASLALAAGDAVPCCAACDAPSDVVPAQLPAGRRAVPGLATTFAVLRDGAGARVVGRGAAVRVHARGELAASGRVFWDTRDGGGGSSSFTPAHPESSRARRASRHRGPR